ncbi:MULTISPECIES: LPXTG cell wall anchor domain-containing protein [Streptomyces]|uniref:LPXTG cell wall anchor domain-containing protein n=1 Tax=Streptomyces bobili TaxID=67280 RepID=A0ABZ1QXN0_9ACTN|nr:LPXTG cell wall anchor domain-containing protein [Streptomyces bobili]
MSSARRPLLTATAAGTLLGALWFVPNAQATQDEPVRTAVTTQVTTQARAVSADSTGTALTADTSGTADSTSGGTRLADTGSFDTTPYIVGGTGLLALGAGFVAYSVRRERLGF